MEIDPKELVITTWHNGGYRPTKGVRIKHLPTGIEVSNDSERLQHHNRQKCIEKLIKELEEGS